MVSPWEPRLVKQIVQLMPYRQAPQVSRSSKQPVLLAACHTVPCWVPSCDTDRRAVERPGGEQRERVQFLEPFHQPREVTQGRGSRFFEFSVPLQQCVTLEPLVKSQDFVVRLANVGGAACGGQ